MDNGGYWKCYTGSSNPSQNPMCWDTNAQLMYDSFDTNYEYGYPDPVFAAVDVEYSLLPEFQNVSSLVALVQAWKTNGGDAPGLKDAGLSLRFTLDGTAADCTKEWAAPDGAVALEYSFKSRIRLWQTSASRLRVWLCCQQCHNGNSPRYASFLNLTDALEQIGYAGLMPSPYVVLNVPLKQVMSIAQATTLQERLCKVIWDVVDERCNSRAWFSLGHGPYGAFELTFIFLDSSNSGVTRMSYLVSVNMAQNDVKAQFPQIDLSYGSPESQVIAHGPFPKASRDLPVGCLSHYDCVDGQFCSTGALQTAAQGFLGNGGPGASNFGCDLCKYCLSDNLDPNDRYCPRDRCGSLAGSYPDCIDASKLFSDFTCRDVYALNMSRVPQTQKSSDPPQIISTINVNSTFRKARFITPYNQLVGALTITQRRVEVGCIIPFRNDSIGRYESSKDTSLGPLCQGSRVTNSPYGEDPTFTTASRLYKGYVDQNQYYAKTECSAAGLPFGFFPHSYDGKSHGPKDPRYIVAAEASNFKVYFSERVTAVEAQNLVTYLHDGGFLDSQTQQVTVEILTLNSNLDLFAIFTFIFTWQVIHKYKASPETSFV